MSFYAEYIPMADYSQQNSYGTEIGINSQSSDEVKTWVLKGRRKLDNKTYIPIPFSEASYQMSGSSEETEEHLETNINSVKKKTKRLDLARTYFDQKISIPRDEDHDDVST